MLEGSLVSTQLTSEEYSQAGDAYLQKQDYQTAINNYTKAIEQAPRQAIYYFKRSKAYYLANELEQTRIDCLKAFGLDPTQANLTDLVQFFKAEKNDQEEKPFAFDYFSKYLDQALYLLQQLLTADEHSLLFYQLGAKILYNQIDELELAIVDINISHKDEKNMSCFRNLNLLSLATLFGRVEVAKLLIAKGLTTTPASLKAALILAINYGQLDMVKYLTPLVVVNGWYGEFLRSAVEENQLTIAEYFLKQGAKPDTFELLHKAVEENSLATVALLLNFGADIDGYEEADGARTPLHIAVANGNVPMTRYLLERGADAELADAYGTTVPNYALSRKYDDEKEWDWEMVNCLLPYKGDANYKAKFLLEAVRYDLEKVQYFVELGANVNYNGFYDQWKNFRAEGPALWIALRNKKMAIADYLLNQGADINLRNEYGSTILKDLIETQDEELIKLILVWGALSEIHTIGQLSLLNQKDILGKTALDYIADKKFKEFKEKIQQLHKNRFLLAMLPAQEFAIEAYDQALALTSEDANFWCGIGLGLAEQANYTAAIQAYDKALVLAPGQSNVLYNKGYALARLGHYKEAIGLYDQVLALKPHEAAHLDYAKGFAWARLGQSALAIKAYDKAMQAISLLPANFNLDEMQQNALAEQTRCRRSQFIQGILLLALDANRNSTKPSLWNQLPINIMLTVVKFFDFSEDALGKCNEQIQGCATFIFEHRVSLQEAIKEAAKTTQPFKIIEEKDDHGASKFRFFPSKCQMTIIKRKEQDEQNEPIKKIKKLS